MADVNVNAPAGQAHTMAPPVRTDDQILPHIRWVPIGKSNCYLDLDKSQSNPIYKITMDILKHTNFFRAFTASCQLDEQWFDLTSSSGIQSDLTSQLVNNNQAFISPSSSDALIKFVNELGYPKKHKFHPRPDSPLHLPNEEPVLGYLKFSAKGKKREVFGMPILGSLITIDIQEASYYQEYLAKVAKHKRYLAGETGSDPDSPLLKPTKPARKPKSTAPKAPPRPLVSKPVTSAQPEPKFTPAKTQGKKRKLTIDISDKPSKATKSRHGFGIGGKLEKNDVPRGPLPPVVIRNLSLRNINRSQRCQERAKQRRTSTPTGSSGHDESSSLYAELGLLDSEEESQEVVPGDDAGGQDPGNAGADEQPIPSLVVHAGSDRKHIDLDVADISLQPLTDQEPASSSGTLSSLQHLSKDLSFGNLFFSDKPSEANNDKATAETEVKSMVSVTIHQDMSLIPLMTSLIIDITSRPESPKVHQQLKATATDTITTTTITLPPPPYQQQSTTNAMMMKHISELEHIMANLLQENKKLKQRLDSHGARLYILEQLDIPHQVSKAVNEVVTDMVDWAMQAPLWSRFRDLPKADMKEILHQRMWENDSYKSHEDHMQLYEALEKSMNRDHSKELTKDLAKVLKKKKKSREAPKTPPGSPPHQPPPPPPPAGPSGASGAPGASGSSQVPPPPPTPTSTNQEGPSKGSAAPRSSKTVASAEYQAWTTTDMRLRPSISLTHVDLQIDEDMAPDEQAQSSDDEDIRSAHIPKVNLRQDWWKPLEEKRPTTPKPAWSIPSSDVPIPTNNWASALASNYSPPPEDSLLVQTGDITTFMDWFCKRRGITELKPQDLEGPAFEIVKVFHLDVIHLQYQMEECHKLLTDSVDDSILRHNVTNYYHWVFHLKMKAAYYPDVGLEQMVPYQIWIEEECKYDIVAMYGISHWWFQRQRFYIDRHTSEGDRSAIRTHIRILSVVRIKVFSMYEYDYIKKIVLRPANLNEHVIDERDFKYRYPSDFEDLYLLNLQEDFHLGIESHQTHLNLTKPQWDATGFEYKHDYTVIDSPRAITFQDRYGVQMMMRFNKIHKFSDDMLQQIDEVLDYRVKEFKINRMNPGLNMRFWTRKDVDMSKAFMFSIQKRLKTRRIFHNQESFVGGRVRDEDYRLLKRTE
nr:E-beta-farnesene synthase [Tanacetum cinerariifolium]